MFTTHGTGPGRSWALTIVALLVAGLLVPLATATADEDGRAPWPQHGSDEANARRAPGPAPDEPGARWFTDLTEARTDLAPEGYVAPEPAGDANLAHPILGPDGTVVLQAEDRATGDHRFVGLAPETGDVAWEAEDWPAPWGGRCGPAIDGEGRLWTRDRWGDALAALDPSSGTLDTDSVVDEQDGGVLCQGTTLHIGGDPERLVAFSRDALWVYDLEGEQPDLLWEHATDDDAPFDGLVRREFQARIGAFTDETLLVPAEVHDDEGEVAGIELVELHLEDGQVVGRADIEVLPDQAGAGDADDVQQVSLLVADATLVAGVRMVGGAAGSGDGSLTAFDLTDGIGPEPVWVEHLEDAPGPGALALGEGAVVTQPQASGENRLLAYDLTTGEPTVLQEQGVVGPAAGATFEIATTADGAAVTKLSDARDDDADRQVGLVAPEGGFEWLFNRREVEHELGLDPGTFDAPGVLHLGPMGDDGTLVIGAGNQYAMVDASGGLGVLPATDVDGARIQDLILVEQLRTLDDDGAPVDLTAQVVEHLAATAGEPTPLTDGVTFAPADVEASAHDRTGRPLDDVEVTVGLLANEDRRIPAILGTPGPDTFIRLDDRFRFVLDETLLPPGAPLFADHGFVQVHPADGELTPELSALELLAGRLTAGSANVFAVPTEGGAAHGLLVDQVWHTFDGSTGIGTPAKADPLMDGLADGAEDAAEGGLSGVQDLLDNIEEGAEGAFDNIFGGGNGDFGDNQRCPNPPCDGSAPQNDCRNACTNTQGDPHLQTFDGRPYDMHAVGEFVAARTDGLEVQLRTRQVGDHPVSITTGVAVGLDGHRVSVTAPPIDATAADWEPVRIDGEVVPLEELEAAPVELGDATLTFHGHLLQLVTGDDHVVTVRGVGEGPLPDRSDDEMARAAADALHLWLTEGTATEWEGLFGTGDGDPDTDFTTRDGRTLGPDPGFDELYDVFVDSWRIGQEESLFDYREGESAETFTDLSVPREEVTVDTLPADARERAEAVCRASGIVEDHVLDGCVVDHALTGEVGFVEVARRADTIEGFRTGRIQEVGAAPDESEAPEAAPSPPEEPASPPWWQAMWIPMAGVAALVAVAILGLIVVRRRRRQRPTEA